MKKFLLLCLLLGITFPCFAKGISKPVIVTFVKNDCEECEMLSEVRQEIRTEYEKKIDFVKINIDTDDCDFQKLKARYNIKNAPTTLFLNNGTTKKVSGFIPQKLYEKEINELLSEN